MIIKEDHRSLLRAQCYKLVQIADTGKNRELPTLLILLFDFIRDLKAAPP
jgi:hypothetical protein